MATVNYTVTTQQGILHPDGPSGPGVVGGVYFLDGSQQTSINANRGDVLVFDMSDPSNAGHEFRFTTDSTDEYTEAYTPGVRIIGNAGNAGSSVTITIPSDAPNELSVYCVSHGIRMGFEINISDQVQNITGATQANPVVITSVAHGFSSGEKVTIDSVVGMTELNTNVYYVTTIDADTFELYSDEARTTSVDGTGFTAYTSGGTATLTGVQGTFNYTVTVVAGALYPLSSGQSGNVFLLDGQRVLDLDIVRGNRYIFDQTDASNIGHELKLNYEQVEGSGTFGLVWTAGVTNNGGTAGVDRVLTWQVPANAPEDMLYTCDAHGIGMGGELLLAGDNGDTIANPADDVASGAYANPTITSVTFGQQYYDGALRYNQTLHRYEFFSEELGWVQTTYAPTVTSVTGNVLDGQLNSITVDGGGFDGAMTVEIVSVDDLYTPLNNPITFTYVDTGRFTATIDARAPYSLQDGTGQVLEAIRFRLTSGITNARAVSGEVEIDRDPEFGVATLTSIGRFFVSTNSVGESTDVENPVVLSASDPDDTDATITFAVAPNTMGFGTNRNLATDGTTVGGRTLGSPTTDPNTQNSNFSVYFEPQVPNQGILKGAVNPWSNGGPGHPDYGANFGSSVRYPGTLEAEHDLTVRATSTTPDGRTTTNDETFRMRVIQPWRYISNISHHYVAGGYIGAESWRVVHRCTASTDTTVSLGVQLAANGVATPNANRSGVRYGSEAVDRWSGQYMMFQSNTFDYSNITENYNMITETAYGLNSGNLSVERFDVQGWSDDTRRKGYCHTGNTPSGISSTVDRFNMATSTRDATLTNSTGYHGYGAATVFNETHGYHHQWGRSTSGAPDGGHRMELATETFSGANYFNLGSLGYAGAVGKALSTWGEHGNFAYWIGYNTVTTCWKGDLSTDTFTVAPFVQTTNNGEGNCSHGLDHGYSLGGYNGVQNNHSDRFNFSNETCVRVASADTTGNAGTSSAAVGWVEK